MEKTADCLEQPEVLQTVKSFLDLDLLVLEDLVFIADYTQSRTAVRTVAGLYKTLRKKYPARDLGYEISQVFSELENIALRSSKPIVDVIRRSRKLITDNS